MAKILIGECKQEVSSFNPVPSLYADFEIARGQELLDYHQGLNTELAGALSVFGEDPELVLIPTYSARSRTSGGTLRQADFDRIADEFVDGVKAAPAADGIYLSLHGAMSADGEGDPEGHLLAEIRKIVGEEVPIVVSLDLHGVLTDRILRHSNAIVAYHTYPHVDFAATGVRAAQLLLKIMMGDVRPVTTVVPIPALVRGNELITETGLFGKFIREAQAIEASHGGLSAGMFIGNPFTDVPALRSNSFVVTDGDAVRAKDEAIHLAEGFWAVRERLQAPLVSLVDAIAALQAASGTVILVDAADATSSGASGDSNLILHGLEESAYPGRILAPIVDPDAVEEALAAGIGNAVQTTVGGKLDPARFPPLPITAHVHLLSDGHFVSESNGALWNAGPTAVLKTEHLTLVVTSHPVNLFDRSLFYAHGQDPRRFDAVVVKSPHCQPHFFDEWAELTVNVDVPGATSANLQSLGHTRCVRPIYPLDQVASFSPQARIFRRS